MQELSGEFSSLRYFRKFTLVVAVILFVCKKLYGRTIKDILGTQGSKKALIAGLGMVLICIYFAVVEVVTIKKIGGFAGGK